MKRAFLLLALLALLGFVAAGCGTSNGPGSGGGGGNSSANGNGAGTQGQDTNSQPVAGGLKNGAYTSAQTMCQLYPLSQLAQQNGLPSNATKDQVAKKISLGQASKSDQESAYRGCLQGLSSGG